METVNTNIETQGDTVQMTMETVNTDIETQEDTVQFDNGNGQH